MKKKAPAIDQSALRRQNEAFKREDEERAKIQEDLDRREKLRKTRQLGRRSLFGTAGGEAGEKLGVDTKLGG